MGKSKSGGLARLPREQKVQFLIGPVSSWFMPKTLGIWTQPNEEQTFFVYGSIGCFLYGKIQSIDRPAKCDDSGQSTTSLGAVVNRLIDIKDDSSRVSCVRFLEQAPYPFVAALTESGSLVIHDCLKSDNLIHFRKTEILSKFIGLIVQESDNIGEQTKRAKFGVTHQINSFAWPNTTNMFLGVSMIKEKTCLLFRLKIKDVVKARSTDSLLTKDTFVENHHKIELNLQHYSSPICLVESKMLNDSTCLLAVAMDDGLIIVIAFDLEQDEIKRNIKLARHNDQICSMSLFVRNQKKFPLGLLASVSRDGLMLIWDIENEFYFADYQAVIETGNNRASSARINWFALAFVHLPEMKQTFVAVTNPDSGITLLELPENARSKIRMKEHKSKQTKGAEQSSIKHNALIFNIEYDSSTKRLISSSLDGNHILWTVQRVDNSNSQAQPIECKANYLIAAMLNSSRVHMMRSSPIRENLVCLALGKAGVKFYTISNNVMECRFDMSTSCSMVARKITKANVSPTSIAWHPSHEYRLAIGTLEGKVFRADITPRKALLTEADCSALVQAKKTVDRSVDVDAIFDVDYTPVERKEESRNGHDGQKQQPKTDGVYSLCWGPNPASPQDVTKFAIYAVGSITHRLFIYTSKESSEKLTNYLDEFQDTSLPEAFDKASEVAWKPSMDLMALGTSDGKIIIVSYLDDSHEDRSNHKLFRKVAIIEGPFGTSFIQCLAWHPTTDTNDSHYFHLAASSNESPAFVFNLKESVLVADVKAQLKLDKAFTSVPSSYDQSAFNVNDITGMTVLSAYVNKLEAHQKAITDIAWSPHEPDQIATSSFDRMCHVWSIDNAFLHARLLSRFAARDRLFTLEWSLVDEDLIFTSGHDSTVWAWRPTENIVRASE